MTERLPITNLLLLLMLTGFLFVSGSLQCAFECLTQADRSHNVAMRIVGCHVASLQPDPVLTCANKACHQGSPQHQDLGGPQLFSLNKLAHPLSSSSRQQMPLLSAGRPLPLAPAQQPVLLADNNADFTGPSQQLRSIRTTVLLN